MEIEFCHKNKCLLHSQAMYATNHMYGVQYARLNIVRNQCFSCRAQGNQNTSVSAQKATTQINGEIVSLNVSLEAFFCLKIEVLNF